jgi:hypothetical protein
MAKVTEKVLDLVTNTPFQYVGRLHVIVIVDDAARMHNGKTPENRYQHGEDVVVTAHIKWAATRHLKTKDETPTWILPLASER